MGYEDPGFLKSKIEKLEKDLKELRSRAVPFLAHQKGPTPGWINAAQVGPGTSQKSAMHLNLDGNQVGSAPRLSVADAAGTVRVELGNLAAQGNSPAQFGIRAADASGAVLFDALGPFGSAKPLNFAAAVIGTNFSSTSFQQVTSSPFSITVPNLGGSNRNLNIMYWFFATAKTSGASGTLSYIRGNIVGFNQTATLKYDKGVGGMVSASLWFFPQGGIPPGTYTCQMEVAVDAGQTCFIDQFFHQVWLAGSAN